MQATPETLLSALSKLLFVLNKIAEMTGVNAVVSTGMANFDMVENIYDLFKKHRGDLNNFVIMQCTSSYPTESKGKETFTVPNDSYHF